MIKLLSNAACGFAVFFLVWSLFYFRVLPRIIGHYGKVEKRRKKYDKEIAKIRKAGD